MNEPEIQAVADALAGRIVLTKISGDLYSACGGKYLIQKTLQSGWIVSWSSPTTGPWQARHTLEGVSLEQAREQIEAQEAHNER